MRDLAVKRKVLQKRGKPYKSGGLSDKIISSAIVGILLLYCLTLLFPVFFMVNTSFKATSLEYLRNPFGLPETLSFESYRSAAKNIYVPTVKQGQPVYYYLWDLLSISILWSVGGTFFSLFVTTLVAYVISRYNFFGRNFLFSLGIVIMITPIIGSLPAAMHLKKMLGVYNNIPLLILTGPSTAFSGMTFLLMYASFKGIPKDYSDAVFVDGGGHYTLLFRFMLPVIMPTFAVFFVLGFLGHWNDYSTFLIWIPSYPNLAIGVYYYQLLSSQYGSSMPQIMAGFVLMVIPTMILYAFAQRLISQKFTVGGLKG